MGLLDGKLCLLIRCWVCSLSQTLRCEVLTMCLRSGRVGSGRVGVGVGKDIGFEDGRARQGKARQGKARQYVALGYGESKKILITGCFVCQEAHILYFVALSVDWDDGFLSFQGLWMASRSPRRHVCIIYTI
ncbi:hypothetical protein QL093DRAFT_2154196 [Fusarium oxysporum]|nr:hypothetical protein QL093DRAFT_2154196 [Fusarium oxysporum]